MTYEEALIVKEKSPEFSELSQEIMQIYSLLAKKFQEFNKKFPLDTNVYWSVVDGEIVPLRDTNLESYY